jgi:Tfp pilus assembly protein PilN
MKKETARPSSINLLRKHDQSLFDTLFSWAISVGRLLIIITQFVALGAFLFRFVLDRQIIDLNDSIRDKQTVVKFMENEEKTYRGLQVRLAGIAERQDQAASQEALLSRIVDLARGKMEFTSLTADAESVSIEGTTNSVTILQRLIDEYRQYPPVTSVSINSIDTEPLNNRITASFSLSLVATPPDDLEVLQ